MAVEWQRKRHRINYDDLGTASVYLSVRTVEGDPYTLRDLLDDLEAQEVPMDAQVRFGSTVFQWYDKSTAEEQEKWKDADARRSESAERWRRQQYEKLKQEFEG